MICSLCGSNRTPLVFASWTTREDMLESGRLLPGLS